MRLGLALVAQPGFAWLDERFVGSYRRQLPPSVYALQIPLRSIARAGGVIVGSSDSPAGPLSPWIHMQGMIEHPLAHERLELYDALRTYTWNPAWAAGEEAERGTLAPGKKADFIVMEEDPFDMPRDKVYQATVRDTFINGRKVEPMRMSSARFLARALLGPRKLI